MQNEISVHADGGMTFAGPKGVGVYQATVIAKALRFYAQTGMKVNRAYTPKNMMSAAANITGQKFAARDYIGAAEALEAYAANLAKEVHQEA